MEVTTAYAAEWPHGLDNGVAPNRRQAIIWTNTGPFHLHIYAALGGDELIASKSYDGSLCTDDMQHVRAPFGTSDRDQVGWIRCNNC